MDARITNNGDRFRPPFKSELPPRTKLKMLILEADEETMEQILWAIETVCGRREGVGQ